MELLQFVSCFTRCIEIVFAFSSRGIVTDLKIPIEASCLRISEEKLVAVEKSVRCKVILPVVVLAARISVVICKRELSRTLYVVWMKQKLLKQKLVRRSWS